MSVIFLTVVTIVFFTIRAVVFQYVVKRHPGKVKSIAYYVLTVCTVIFLFFPICIFLGNEVCWDFDVATHKTVLLTASVLILLFCAWVWIEIFKYPKIDNNSRVPDTSKIVSTIIVAVAILVALIVAILGSSSYWAPLVGY